jgi:flagellar hook-basal body complex protein FliE
MTVETNGSINSILKNYNTDLWSKNLKSDAVEYFKSENVNLSSFVNKDGQISFSELLKKSLNEVNHLQVEANSLIEKLVSGKTKNIHETMLAVEKADIAFRAMNQIRQKVIDSYQEIMKMQI